MQTPARSPEGPALDAIHVMAHVWRTDIDDRTEVGDLIDAAKYHGDADSARELGARLTRFVAAADVSRGRVVAVPANPMPELSVPAILAAALDDSPGFVSGAALIERGAPGPRVRDLPPSDRESAVAAAEYRVVGDVIDATIILVDDVVLTGTTLDHLARLFRSAGAARVEAVVAARSRRVG